MNCLLRLKKRDILLQGRLLETTMPSYLISRIPGNPCTIKGELAMKLKARREVSS